MKKNLSPSKGPWQFSSSEETYPALNENLDLEVCIVGGGIAGLSIAYALLAAGKKVTLLEAKRIGEGETGNTSAHLSNALDEGFYQLEKMHGKKKAQLAAASHGEAITWIENLIKSENIACDFKRLPGYLFTLKEDKDELTQEQAAAERAGLKVTFAEEQYLGKCVVFSEQARFNPLKYIQGLAKAVAKKGGKIYENTRVAQIDYKKKLITLENKKTVKFEVVVTATNAPMFSKLSMHFKINPQRSYMIGLKIPVNSVKDALYWDTEEPYHYARLTPYDELHDLLLVGGEDHRVGAKANEHPYLALKAWAEKYLKVQSALIAHTWSGQILEPVDYLAYIGRNPKAKNAFMVSGDSGHGLTHGTIAAMLICDLILEKKNPYEDLYKVPRLPLRAFSHLSKNAASSSLAYFKHLLPLWQASPIAGQGKVVQRGFNKLAMYKDEANKLHLCSGICPHLGAVLSFNEIEKTWDCAAHGSRFNLQGEILNGPAGQPLKCPLKGKA